MSKIAKIPVEIKPGVQVNLTDEDIKVSGPKGNLNFMIPRGVSVKIENEKIIVTADSEEDKKRALSGLVRANIANMVTGVTDGFNKKLELTGVGYRAQASGNTLTLSVGYSHPVIIKADQSIAFSVEENEITVSGPDKAIVGDIAAKVRAVRPPEPYKGKGIKYKGEHIRRKVGKAAKAVGGAINMNNQKTKRQVRTRNKIKASDRPRVTVHRSNKYISAQIIDDQKNVTLVGVSEKELKIKGTKTEKAKELGLLLARKGKDEESKKSSF